LRWQTSPLNEFYIQVAFKISNSYNEGNILKWQSGSTVIGSLTFEPLYQTLSIWKGDKVTRLGTSSTQLLYNQWYYIEIHMLLDATSGVATLKIDGLSQFTFSGSTTPSATTIDLFYLVGNISGVSTTTSAYYWADDIVVNDITGVNNNSWPNGAKIVLLFPTGRGYSSQWEKMAHLDNYENVDNFPSLDPVDYLLTNLNERLDLYLINDLPIDAFSVATARIDAWALKNSGSDIMLNLALRTGDVTFLSIDHELGVSYALYQWLHQMNPGTSINWTVADVNNLQGGMRSEIPE
jgi:hypothetical protein